MYDDRTGKDCLLFITTGKEVDEHERNGSWKILFAWLPSPKTYYRNFPLRIIDMKFPINYLLKLLSLSLSAGNREWINYDGQLKITSL